ncbi:uncharacterized protein N7484_011627 [Penicillium longicatenatum]|uniref:uncharacterized protein n=1 Tax=Penicillium longicatenatum TaxID=1561947 RepID=UPI0025490E4D|nr:uncharacterized protein N7484_011627 [Penicillium longicatenatum]KAJ5631527.1 hypothetical protein N7484_011627 [Penicillium longicatenatum]
MSLALARKLPTSRLGPLARQALRPASVSQTRLLASQSVHRAVINTSKAQGVHIHPSSRKFYTTQPKMASTPTELKQTLTPSLLEDIRTFWFDHLSDEKSLILPGQSEMKRWFATDADFDKACVAQFQPALEAIISSGATATDILSTVDTKNPLTWLSLLLLLDQVPRNCYRGPESKTVFTSFDPLACEIAIKAISLGIPVQNPIRYRLSYRFWFQMPLMHSEDVGVHYQAVKVHEETARDMEAFLKAERGSLDEDERECFDVLFQKRDLMKGWLDNTLDFEKRHLVIVEQFGRYPHRNAALGRVSTEDEVNYLDNGGETFG